MLRGSAEFVDADVYLAFARDVVARHNRQIETQLAEERAVLRALPSSPIPSCAESPVLATLRIQAGMQREWRSLEGSTGYAVRAPKWRMRLPSVSFIRNWALARMERLWSQLAPRKQAGEIAAVAVDAVRSRAA